MSTAMPSQPQGHRAADVLRLLQTAFPKRWKNHLHNYGITDPADLPAAEFARFTERVFWLVKQTGNQRPRRVARHSSGSGEGAYGSGGSGKA